MLRINNKRGFTLIETLVGSIIFLVVALATYQAFTALMKGVAVSRAKIAATAFADEQFEIIRNLPYADVGIIGGIPAGKIPHIQTLTRGSYTFTASTTIRNIDDPFDGTIGGTPNDSSPADYKLVDLDISCAKCDSLAPLKFTALFSPRALETASSNGALFIQVFDASGAPIPNTTLHIVNTATNPDTIIDDITDNTGWLKIIDAPPGINTYNITATKSGYTTDQTYPLGGAAGNEPVNTDATVSVGQVTQKSLSIDKLSSISISTLDSSCDPVPNIGFDLTGTKTIGTGILKYPTKNFTTNTSGQIDIPNLGWDTYVTSLTDQASHDLIGVKPSPSFFLNPNENKNIQIIVSPHQGNALSIFIKDQAGIPIDGATVQITKNAFDETKITNSGTCPASGQVFWNGLLSGIYTINVTKNGYQDYSNTFTVPTSKKLDITLTP